MSNDMSEIKFFSGINTVDDCPSAHGCLVRNKSKVWGGRIHEHLKEEGNENEAER